MVAGGLVEPLLRGAFNRAHSDVDIEVPMVHLKEVAQAAGTLGYVMTVRLARIKLTVDRNLELYLCVRPSNRLLAWRSRHLRLWRLNARGQLEENRFPSYIDVFPFVLDEKELHLLDGDFHLPLGPAIVREAKLPNGITVPVQDPFYVNALRCAQSQATC
jgi:hypothetical protein